MSDCKHTWIDRFDTDPPGHPLWACADCRLRFYPHGPECDRGCTHNASPDPGLSSDGNLPEGRPEFGAVSEPPFPYYADDDVRMGRR